MNSIENIKEQAEWIRNDIKNTDLEDLIKESLLLLDDEILLDLILNVEKNYLDCLTNLNDILK